MPANENDAMTVVVNELERCKRGLEVTIPEQRVADEMARAFREYAHHARVPGFRKGHIPMDVVRRRFGKEVRDEVVGRLVQSEALRILEERRLDPVEPPVLEEVTYEDGQPLKFRATFEVRPAIEVNDYRGLRVTVPKHTVTDEMVEASVRGLAERAARLEAIAPARPTGTDGLSPRTAPHRTVGLRPAWRRADPARAASTRPTPWSVVRHTV